MTTTRNLARESVACAIVVDPRMGGIMSRNTRTNVPAATDTTVPTMPTTPDGYADAYAAATGSDRTVIRNAATAAMTAALDAGEFADAAAYRAVIRDRMIPTAATATVVDYDALVVARIHALVNAAAAIATGAVRPTGVPTDHTYGPTVRDAFAIYGIDVPTDANDYADDAVAIATDRVARSTVRNDIGSVITRAFGDAPVGTRMTVREIAIAGATDTYRPGDGAIAARMFGGSGVDGFTADDTTVPRSVVRTA